MEKAQIRKLCLESRRRLSPSDVAAKSAAIIARLHTLPPFVTGTAFLCYVSSKDNEVDTHGLIESLLRAGNQVLAPIAEPGGVLLWSRLEALADLAPARFGILEPKPECRRILIPPQDAVVIVPGIAFSPECRRIGYGGGYFDRFLATHHGPSIALAFDTQIVRGWQPEPHDRPVDYVVTESQVFRRPQ